MKRNILIRAFLLVVAISILAACTPSYVQDAVDDAVPGARIVSSQKVEGQEQWCVIAEKGGQRFLLLIAEKGPMVDVQVGVSRSDFENVECTNWDR